MVLPERTGAVVRVQAQVHQAESLLRAAASGIESLDAPDAVSLARSFSAIAKCAYASSLRCIRAAGDGAVRLDSGETCAASLLSNLSGTSIGKAKNALLISESAQASPVLEKAFRDGELSIEQVGLIAPIAVEDPRAAESLVDTAKTASLRVLRQEVGRVRHARGGEEAAWKKERLLHARRYCRTWVPEGGGLRVDAFLGTTDGSAFKTVLDDLQAKLEITSSRAGMAATYDQLRADALMAAVGAERTCDRGADRPLGRPEMLVRVDASALVRGEVRDGEICEVAGIGPVSVRAARSLLGEALWSLLVFDGVDVRTVTSMRRAVPKRVENALLARDAACVVPGCGASERLQIDHWARDFAWNGPTELANLCRLCPAHHRMKSRTGWQLDGGPGRWRWRPPKPISLLARAHPRRSDGAPSSSAVAVSPAVRGALAARDP